MDILVFYWILHVRLYKLSLNKKSPQQAAGYWGSKATDRKHAASCGECIPKAIQAPPRGRPHLLPHGKRNQMRLFLHAGAYWIMWTLRAAMPRRSSWRRMQFDTLRLLAVTLVVRVVELQKQVRLHLPACTPDQAIFTQVLGRLPRLIC